MTMLTDFVAELKAIPLVSTKVGSNVYPVIGKNTKPSIVYSLRGDHASYNYSSSTSFNYPSITLNIYTNSYSELDGLRKAIVGKFNGFSGMLNTSGTYVAETSVITTIEDYNSETKTYRQVLDIQITYEEI